MFRLGYWLDQVSPPFIEKPGGQIIQLAEGFPVNGTLKVRISGPDFDDYEQLNNTSILLHLGAKGDAETRLGQAGLQVIDEDGKLAMDSLTWDSKHRQLNKTFTFGELDNPVIIDTIYLAKERHPKELFYIPALLLLALIILLQLRREKECKLSVLPRQPSRI